MLGATLSRARTGADRPCTGGIAMRAEAPTARVRVRTRVLVVVALVVGTMSTLPSTAVAEQVHSGTIVGGFFTFGPSSDCRSESIQHWCPGCQLVPDCLAWLESRCDPALVGHDAAWMTSIEDVAALADGLTP